MTIKHLLGTTTCIALLAVATVSQAGSLASIVSAIPSNIVLAENEKAERDRMANNQRNQRADAARKGNQKSRYSGKYQQEQQERARRHASDVGGGTTPKPDAYDKQKRDGKSVTISLGHSRPNRHDRPDSSGFRDPASRGYER